MPDIPLSPQTIRNLAYSFQSSRVVLSAHELGVFSVIGEETLTSAEVAKRIKSDRRATDRLLNALVALGLLVKRQGRFTNTAASAAALVKTSPDYLAGLMHTVHLWDTWSTLTEAVKRGKKVRARMASSHRGARWRDAFIAAMHDRARKQAPVIVGEMNLEGVRKVLDVGGGSGAFAMAFVKRGDGITATVFDLPPVLRLTKKYVGAEGLLSRIDFIGGDYNRDRLPKGYDVVFLSAIIHSNSLRQNAALMKKCAASLNPGGHLVVQDFIMDESRCNPPGGALFSLNMLVGTERGDTFTEEEVKTWMRDAGLEGMLRHETSFGVAQVVGTKPR